MASSESGGVAQVSANRWLQLIAGVVCMVAAANIPIFLDALRPEIQNAHGWSRASIQIRVHRLRRGADLAHPPSKAISSINTASGRRVRGGAFTGLSGS